MRGLRKRECNPANNSVDDELLVGSSLLLAPIMETGAHSRYVYLPQGEWHNYWTGEKLEGGRSVLAQAPLYAREGLPIFVRHGAILPSRPVRQFNSDEPETAIHLDVYPVERGSCRLWEYAETFSHLAYTASDQRLLLTLENHTPVRRTYTVACRDGRAITSGNALGVALVVNAGIASIELAPSSLTQLEVTLEIP